jgi:Ser/Thr protein kinase RdoA (MazF antagonist)
MYDPSRFDQDALRSMLAWLRVLADGGLAVPEPVRSDRGTVLVPVSTQSGMRLCTLSSKVPGEPRPGKKLRPDCLRRVGRQAARIHLQAERFSPPDWFTRPAWGWEWVFGGEAALWKTSRSVFPEAEMRVLEAAAELAGEELEDLGTGNGVFGLIHRDLTLANLLFHDGGVYVIDFDRCGWGYYLFDLAVTLSALGPDDRRGSELRFALLEGYREERALPDDYRRRLATFMIMRLASRINWGLRTPEDRPASRQKKNFMSKALSKIRRLLETGIYPAFLALGIPVEMMSSSGIAL